MNNKITAGFLVVFLVLFTSLVSLQITNLFFPGNQSILGLSTGTSLPVYSTPTIAYKPTSTPVPWSTPTPAQKMLPCYAVYDTHSRYCRGVTPKPAACTGIEQLYEHFCYPNYFTTPTPTPAPVSGGISCKVVVYKGNSSMNPPLRQYMHTALDQNQLRIQAGEYYIYGVQIYNKTTAMVKVTGVSAQQLFGAKEPIQIVKTDSNCVVSSDKQVSCKVSDYIPPLTPQDPAPVSFDNNLLVRILPKTSDPKTSTLFKVQTSAGSAQCATMLFFTSPTPTLAPKPIITR